jgi:CO/xanthine dehydrogenase FAD-binding subunit
MSQTIVNNIRRDFVGCIEVISSLNDMYYRNTMTIMNNQISTEEFNQLSIEQVQIESALMDARILREELREQYQEQLLLLHPETIRAPTIRAPKAKQPKIISRALKRADSIKTGDDCCSICSNVHVMSDSCVTDCGHRFGGDCYKQWINCCAAQKKTATCPICRATNKEITVYRPRKTPIKIKGPIAQKVEKPIIDLTI